MLVSWSYFFKATAPPESDTLSLHDALPIFHRPHGGKIGHDMKQKDIVTMSLPSNSTRWSDYLIDGGIAYRSEEHTSELQSQSNLVCRLLLEKKKTIKRQEHGQATPTTHRTA